MKRIVLTLLCFECCFSPAGVAHANLRKDRQESHSPVRTQEKGTVTDASTQKGEKAGSDRQELLNRIVGVLRSTAESSKDWRDLIAASRVQAQVADITWSFDSITARGYLIKAWETASKIEEAQKNQQNPRSASARTNVRREVLMIARKREPELARQWLEYIAKEAEGGRDSLPRSSFNDRSQRATLLLEMAMSTVADDPAAAAELATESLRDGISFGLQNVLLALQEKSFDLSKSVFLTALARLRTVGMLDPNELLILNAYLFTPGKVFAANTTEQRNSTSIAVGQNRRAITAAADLDPQLSLTFLRLAADLLLHAPLPSTTTNPEVTAREQVSAIGFLMKRVSERLPEQAEALRQHAQQLEVDAHFAATPPPERPDLLDPRAGENQSQYAERRTDLLERRADEESDPLRRNILYAEAALATTVEQYQRGWRIAGKIQDQSMRADIVNWLASRAALHFAKAGSFDKVHDMVQKNDDPIERAGILVVGAQGLIKAKDLALANEWLSAARTLMRKAEPDENWTKIGLGVAAAYGQFDEVLALESLGDAIKLMDKFPLSSAAHDRMPFPMHFSGFSRPVTDITFGTSGFGLSSALKTVPLAQAEFVIHMLSGITTLETRGFAIVTLCRLILETKDGSAPSASYSEDGANARLEQ